ncbi:MAG: hypothetical protein L3J14_00105 [Flavobacteriaceae bacterium]|nr:hypothetical protein [Flavobacteriaceae bacterium]
MKKLVIVCVALITLNAQGQKDVMLFQKNTKKEFIENLTPQEFSELKTKKMTLRLDLTESQQDEIQKIHFRNAIDRKFKKEERRKKGAQIKALKLSKEERLQMMNNRLDKQIEMKKQFREVLNEKQYEKWEKRHEYKARKMKSRGKRKGMKQGREKRQ